jgi:hypothetical protein
MLVTGKGIIYRQIAINGKADTIDQTDLTPVHRQERRRSK